MPDKIHLIVATVVEKDSKFLMVKETKFGVQVIKQPAGHVEPGEDILQAAIRETMRKPAGKFQFAAFWVSLPILQRPMALPIIV